MNALGTTDYLFLLYGAAVTILLCLCTMMISIPAAIIIGLLRSAQKKSIFLSLIKTILTICISAVRGTPLMLQLIFFFFGLSLMGINLSPLTAALLGLSIYSTAYMAEIVRTGIESIPKAQWEGAFSLGFSYIQSMQKIIIPQALRIMLPPFVSFFIGLIKDSSMCAVIGFAELTMQGRIIVERTSQSLLVFLIVSLIYFIICFPLSRVSQRIEKALKV